MNDPQSSQLVTPHGGTPVLSGYASRPVSGGPRAIAVKILSLVEQRDAYLDKLLDYELSISNLHSRDRRLLTELATGVLRWESKLDWVLAEFYHGEYQQIVPVVRNAMRVALYQILYLNRIPFSAAVNESVAIVKSLKGNRPARAVNGVLRSIIRNLDGLSWPDRLSDLSGYLSVMYSHPRWMVDRWLTRYGSDETERLLDANNRRPELVVRVNRARATTHDLAVSLQSDGVVVRQARYAPGCLVVEGIGAVSANPLFTQGLFSVQDESSQLAALLANPQPGMEVIDLCAGPGGKTMAMAEFMRGDGRIVAVDRYKKKVGLIDRASQRLGFGGMVRTVATDARNITLEPADVVLVDAPCSGLGVIARKPDIKRRRQPTDIANTVRLTLEILRHAATLVRHGGRLVYTTCTIEPEENEDLIQSFLVEHPQYAIVEPGDLLPKDVTDGPFLRTLPHRHCIDGAFGVAMTLSGGQ